MDISISQSLFHLEYIFESRKMDVSAKVESILKIDDENFLSCSGKDYPKLLRSHPHKESLKLFETIINGMGELSAKAQGLKVAITNSIKFLGTDHRVYIRVRDNQILGFVKVGEKNLFHRDYIGNIKQLKPTCVLDFYVHESCQREGIGRQIFQRFLAAESKSPEKLGYDRPSPKLISFLKKHYGLAKFIPQNNNFVIFDKFFEMSPPIKIEPSSKQLRPKSQLPSNYHKLQQFDTKLAYETCMGKQLQPHCKDLQRINKHNNLKNTNSQGFPFAVNFTRNPVSLPVSNFDANGYKK